MKKFQNLGKNLSKPEQKKIFGGYEPPAGSCQAQFPTEYGYTVVTGLSQADAQLNAETYHTHWCCDSCCTASWSDHTGCPS